MKRLFLVVAGMMLCIHLAGCSGWVVRTSEVRKLRLDQEISGNRGFIFGKPTAAAKKPVFEERKTYRIEIEVPQWKRKEKSAPAEKESAAFAPKEDKALWGNRGYFFGRPQKKEEVPVKKTPIAKVKEKISQIFRPRPKETGEIRTYKAKKGDTLQKISRRFYGTTKKWPLLYKANRDKLKSPDSLYPGQVLVIPEVEQFKK